VTLYLHVNAHAENRYLLCGLFLHLKKFFAFKIARSKVPKELCGVLEGKKAVVCLMEKTRVFEKLHSGAIYGAGG
jgi:hypothetical protein